MSRRNMGVAPINAATFEQMYRNETARCAPFVIPKMRTCPCCKKPRSHTQFDEGKRDCKACRRQR